MPLRVVPIFSPPRVLAAGVEHPVVGHDDVGGVAQDEAVRAHGRALGGPEAVELLEDDLGVDHAVADHGGRRGGAPRSG